MVRPLRHWADSMLPAGTDYDAIPSPGHGASPRPFRRSLRPHLLFFSPPNAMHAGCMHLPDPARLLHSSLVTGPLGTLTRRRLRTSRDTRPTFHDAHISHQGYLSYPRFRLSSLCQLHRSLGSRHRSYLGPSPKVTESSNLNPIHSNRYSDLTASPRRRRCEFI